jgi:AbrB family looped-hinge helix DNA binding protein
MIEPEFKPLTGKALLQKAKELSHLPQREKAKLCGYYSVSRSQRTRINLTEFYLALIEARGIDLGAENATKNGRGRERTYRVSVHKNGQIVIGAAYTAQMDLKPGDEFEIKLGYKHIHLKQLDPGEQVEDY